MTAKIGSTIADSWPHCHDLNLLKPALLIGIETAKPSGAFCNPIPIASAIAPPNVKPISIPEAIAPKATPTANPSGIL